MLGQGEVRLQAVFVTSHVPAPVAELHLNPVGHDTPLSQVSGTQTLALPPPLMDSETQVADSRPVFANVQSESAVHPMPLQRPFTQAWPVPQSLAALHVRYGLQNPFSQAIDPGHWLELVQADNWGLQK